ncbi:MAG: NAD(P)-dependent oxidoreductase [Chloroflexota bacterium]|nr:NAD(P)-dependent oxidoreductase [Chloroflexota bacterium]
MALKVHFYQFDFLDYSNEFKPLMAPDITITNGSSIPSDADYEVLVHPTPSREWLEASPNLKAVVIPWAGIPEKTREVLSDYPNISLHNLHHNNYNTAELGFALLLAAAKYVIPLDQKLRKNDWRPRYDPQKAIMLRGRTALILGFGEIGQALAEYCSGMGMGVIATKKHPESYSGNLNVEIYSNDQLHVLLPKADVLLIALPLTEETENLIGETEINLLPEDSILINIGRGPIVNQHALYNALKSGHLHSAGSDVWYNYPGSQEARKNTPPADLPFGELENFVLSPHRGGMVKEVESQRAKALANLLNAASRGEPIPNKVDIEAGY